MNTKTLLLLCLTGLLSSCATSYHETSLGLRRYVNINKHDKALKLLKKSPLAEDKNSKLLYLIETGLLEHYQGNFAGSIAAFSEAKELNDRQYTSSASGKIKSVVLNDASDVYYGEKYETSLIYFYLSLNYYLQAEKELDGIKRKALLAQARSEILGWDSYLTEMKQERAGQALFKEDLLAKTFGALVHEAQNNSKDDQIALQLYQDARSVFFKNYNLFPSYNDSFKIFRENFANFHKISEKEVSGKYVLATKHSEALSEFLTTKILLLTKKIRPQDLKNQTAKLKPSPAVLKEINQVRGQITFLVQEGLITEKSAKKYVFPIDLGPQAGFGAIVGMGNHIEFELPQIEGSPKLSEGKLQALDPSGHVVSESPLSVVAPIAELAEQAINEHSTAIAAKTAARITTKYIALLAASYASYNAASREKNGGIAMLVVMAAHAGGVAAINESEKADVRFWSTLPSNIRMGHLSVPDGIYKFRAVYSDGRITELGGQQIVKGQLAFVMNNQFLKSSSIKADTPELTSAVDKIKKISSPYGDDRNKP